MSLPLNVQYLLIAAVPVIFLLVAVMRFGWGVAKAAPLGMGIAFLLAVTVFRASPLQGRSNPYYPVRNAQIF